MNRAPLGLLLAAILLTGCPPPSFGIITLGIDEQPEFEGAYYRDFAYARLRSRLAVCAKRMGLTVVSNFAAAGIFKLSTFCPRYEPSLHYYMIEIQGLACKKGGSRVANPCRIVGGSKEAACAPPVDGPLSSFGAQLSKAVDEIVQDEARTALANWATATNHLSELSILSMVPPADDALLCPKPPPEVPAPQPAPP